MTRKALPLVAALALTLTACGMSGAGTGAPGRGNVITAEQMVEVNAVTAWEAVQKLRPAWLTTRGPTSITNSEPTSASVFLNGNMIGNVEALRNVRINDVEELRYYEASEAGARFGMGHSRGVIDIIMKGSGRQ